MWLLGLPTFKIVLKCPAISINIQMTTKSNHGDFDLDVNVQEFATLHHYYITSSKIVTELLHLWSWHGGRFGGWSQSTYGSSACLPYYSYYLTTSQTASRTPRSAQLLYNIANLVHSVVAAGFCTKRHVRTTLHFNWIQFIWLYGLSCWNI